MFRLRKSTAFQFGRLLPNTLGSDFHLQASDHQLPQEQLHIHQASVCWHFLYFLIGKFDSLDTDLDE
jgi:hypothetical protein